MLDKIIKFLNQYCYTDEAIKKCGKYKVISAGLIKLIERGSFTVDELRKELSLYTKRIISIREFNQLLDYEGIEYCFLLCEG